MQRKLVQMGKHTLMTAIPSKWIQKHHLKKGDDINFNEVDNKLVATATSEVYERKTEINLISPKVEYVWRVLQPAYISGCDEVILHFKDKNTLKVIQQSVNLLLGFEIVETSPNKIKIKSISKQLDEEFPTILRRTFFVLHQMIHTFKEILEQKELSRLEEINSLEMTINKYTMFLKRIINRTGYKYPHYTYLLVTFLELTANHLDYLRRYLVNHPKVKMDKTILKEYHRLYDLFNRVYDLYYDYSEEKFRWIAEEQPHFNWFSQIKDQEIKFNFRMIAEYLVQISRQIVGLNLKNS
ncbi:MAG: hypothetical protein WCV90_05780 [Candidatus Woesearchaeota archaeon]|jgi:phosphate uptake regulator